MGGSDDLILAMYEPHLGYKIVGYRMVVCGVGPFAFTVGAVLCTQLHLHLCREGTITVMWQTTAKQANRDNGVVSDGRTWTQNMTRCLGARRVPRMVIVWFRVLNVARDGRARHVAHSVEQLISKRGNCSEVLPGCHG